MCFHEILETRVCFHTSMRKRVCVSMLQHGHGRKRGCVSKWEAPYHRKRVCVQYVFLCVSSPRASAAISLLKADSSCASDSLLSLCGCNGSCTCSGTRAFCTTQPEKTEPPDAGSAASNNSDAIVTGSDKQAVQEPAALVAKPADSDQTVDVAGEEHRVTCRRCAQAAQRSEALETPKFRPELRWTCKACHACQTQLARHGIEIKTLLNESEAVTFFAEARAERENSIDKRLTYAQARGMLKQAMVESSSREDREGSHGAFQPLAYYELKGYDTQRIEELAEYREHPILGATYRVDIC